MNRRTDQKQTGFRGLAGQGILVPVLIWLAALCLAAWPGGGPAPALAQSCYSESMRAAKPDPVQIKSCIGVQESLYTAHAATMEGARYLYRLGRLYSKLYDLTGQASHLASADDYFRRLVNRYKASNLADDALYLLGVLLRDKYHDLVGAYTAFTRIEYDYPKGDMAALAKKERNKLSQAIEQQRRDQASGVKKPALVKPKPAVKPAPSPAAVVEAMRHWSAKTYTRVVLDVSRPVKFKTSLVRTKDDKNRPASLIIDLAGARLGSRVDRDTKIPGGHLERAEISPKGDGVRVRLEIEHLEGYKVFALRSPDRVVIDVSGPPDKPQRAAHKPSAKWPLRGQPAGPSLAHKVPRGHAKAEAGAGLVQQLGLGVKTVVIDPGHGGRDPGMTTCRGVREKTITLAVAKKLAYLLRKKLKLTVYLTRSDDRYPPLEERTAIANTKEADLFISIHVNSAKNHRLSGVETYFLNMATEERAIDLAARENATTTKSISDMQSILNDLLLSTKINESNRLAFQIQRNVVSYLRKTFPGTKSLGVKQAPFYVLLGARMPSVLIEVGFGSNKTECLRLEKSDYQSRLAHGIYQGLRAYMDQLTR